MSVASPLLELRDLTVEFGGLRAVSKLSMTLAHREFIGLIGPNGSGKTTVFNSITGLVKPSSGDILLEGKTVVGLFPNQIANRGISRTFQNIRLFSRMTVAENVGLAIHAVPQYSPWAAFLRTPRAREADERVREETMEYLKELGLDQFANVRAATLPYGVQRKVEIARALATKPKVLLLDEPAAGMNDEECAQLVGLLRLIYEKYPVSIILVEHHMSVVMEVCQRVTVINLGTKLAEGTPAQIQGNEEVIKAYLGERRRPNAKNQ